MSAEVRRDDALLVREEGMSVRQGLGIRDIDGGAEETVAIKCLQQFVCCQLATIATELTGGDQRAATDVKEESFGLEEGWN